MHYDLRIFIIKHIQNKIYRSSKNVFSAVFTILQHLLNQPSGHQTMNKFSLDKKCSEMKTIWL